MKKVLYFVLAVGIVVGAVVLGLAGTAAISHL